MHPAPRALALTALLTAASCGYRVMHAERPFGAARIAVEPFDELVPLGIASEVTRQLRLLLAADGVELAANPSHADAVLRGVIVSSRTAGSPALGGDGGGVPAYRVNVQVKATLTSQAGAQLWQTDQSGAEDFLTDPSKDPNANLRVEAQRRRALTNLAQALARALHHQLVVAAQTQPAQEG